MLTCGLWEDLIETTDRGQEETLTEGISEGEVLAVVAGKEKCIKPFAAIVEEIVKFLLSQLAVNPFIAANVLEIKAVEANQEDFKTEAQECPILKEEVGQDHKISNSLR